MAIKHAGFLKSLTAGDILLFALLLFLTIAGMVYVSVMLPKGAEVVVEVNNRIYSRLPLTEDRMVNMDGLTIEIKAGKVRVREADCPNKLCVRQGWIDRGSIICLPKRVVISIQGGHAPRKKREVDATTG